MPSSEVAAMGAVEEALSPLDDEAVLRVLKWAVARFASDLAVSQGAVGSFRGGPASTSDVAEDLEVVDQADQDHTFENFDQLFGHCAPTSPQEHFLVAAYWLQVHESRSSFGSSEINKLLREQGVENKSLNKVADRLRQKRPNPINQTGGGAADKTRRVMKLTTPGVGLVAEMIKNGG